MGKQDTAERIKELRFYVVYFQRLMREAQASETIPDKDKAAELYNWCKREVEKFETKIRELESM